MNKIVMQVMPIDRKNLSRILEIEQDSFSCPWTSKDFTRMYRSQKLTGISLEVVKNQSSHFSPESRSRCETVGFLFFYRRGEDTIQIWNMAVDPRFRRQGCGTALIEHIKRKLTMGKRRKKICVLVSETDLYTQLFLRSCGFLWEETVQFQCSGSNAGLLASIDVYLMVHRNLFVPRNRLQFGGCANASDV